MVNVQRRTLHHFVKGLFIECSLRDPRHLKRFVVFFKIPANTSPEPRFAWDAEDIFAWNMFRWQHWWEHSKATLTPVQLAPTEQVMGAILCAWEMTFEQEICPIMARLAAFSERTWTLAQTRGYDAFRNAFRRLFDLSARLIQDR